MVSSALQEKPKELFDKKDLSKIRSLDAVIIVAQPENSIILDILLFHYRIWEF